MSFGRGKTTSIGYTGTSCWLQILEWDTSALLQVLRDISSRNKITQYQGTTLVVLQARPPPAGFSLAIPQGLKAWGTINKYRVRHAWKACPDTGA